MGKILSILFLFCFLYSLPAFSEEIEINSEIISLGTDSEFFIIRYGEDAGIEIGDGFIVHRLGEKIAEAQVIEVRPAVSAAEMLKVIDDYEIQEGDKVLLVKNPLIRTTPDYSVEPTISEKGDTFSLDIYSESKSVFTYATLILRENGFSIISSNRGTGIMIASKPIALSLLKELWADAVAAIGHSLVATLEIKGTGNFFTLSVAAFKEHSQKARYIKRPITRNSKYYSELVKIISEIKERSEY